MTQMESEFFPKARRAAAWWMIRHCARIEGHPGMFGYWTLYEFCFYLAHRLYPYPPGEPKEKIGFNALETVYYWKFLEEGR